MGIFIHLDFVLISGVMIEIISSVLIIKIKRELGNNYEMEE